VFGEAAVRWTPALTCLFSWSFCISISLKNSTASGRSSKYWCLSAYLQVNLSAGSIFNKPFTKFIAFFGNLHKYLIYTLNYLYSRVSGLEISGNFMPKNLGFLEKLSYWLKVNGPNIFYIRYSWSISFSPGNKGFPSVSSHNKHPIALTLYFHIPHIDSFIIIGIT
jgi:hypothetical protein